MAEAERPRAVAVNVGANTNEPGFRGPIYPDGSFEFVPIPEDAPTREPVPTYGELPLSIDIPEALRDTPTHFDPEFAGFGPGDAYTYGDPYGVKARPLLDLDAGDRVYFYATLDPAGEGAREPWLVDGWGAYLVGRFVLARDPIPGEAYPELPPAEQAAFATNAHVKRDPFDAAVLLEGDPEGSGLLDRAVPLSAPDAGVSPNRIVTELSADSGAGPWWRRPLRFDAAATAELVGLEDGALAGHPLLDAGA
ncbi:MAG: hypothetical protein U5J98_04515 [Halobacteriales archaeon]|nr:hypothetical protein [Halobacteriales archaeon]